MSTTELFQLIDECGRDEQTLARRIVAAFRDASDDTIAVAFDVVLRSGVLDHAAANRLLEQLRREGSTFDPADVADLENEIEDLRARIAGASNRHASDSVALASELKAEIEISCGELARIDDEIHALDAKLKIVRQLAARVGE